MKKLFKSPSFWIGVVLILIVIFRKRLMPLFKKDVALLSADERLAMDEDIIIQNLFNETDKLNVSRTAYASIVPVVQTLTNSANSQLIAIGSGWTLTLMDPNQTLNPKDPQSLQVNCTCEGDCKCHQINLGIVKWCKCKKIKKK